MLSAGSSRLCRSSMARGAATMLSHNVSPMSLSLSLPFYFSSFPPISIPELPMPQCCHLLQYNMHIRMYNANSKPPVNHQHVMRRCQEPRDAAARAYQCHLRAARRGGARRRIQQHSSHCTGRLAGSIAFGFFVFVFVFGFFFV